MASYTCSHGRSFDPAKESCADCDAAPAVAAAIQPGEGESMCAEAARRGLPDGFDVEELIYAQWRAADARAAHCIARSDELSESLDEDAIRWEAAAAKWADTAIKAAKIVATKVDLRERIAAADRADRLESQREKH